MNHKTSKCQQMSVMPLSMCVPLNNSPKKESHCYTMVWTGRQDGFSFAINPGYHRHKISDIAGDGALEEGIISYDDIFVEELGGVRLSNNWKNGSWKDERQDFYLQLRLTKCWEVRLDNYRHSRTVLTDIDTKLDLPRTKMCLKSPGTPLKASSAHICPRTFETHFM